MNRRRNYPAYIALVLALLVIAGSIYWYGSDLHQAASELILLPPTATSSVTIDSDQLTRLQTQAHRLEEIQDILASSTVSRLLATSTRAYQSAQVTARPPQSPYDTLVIDRGVMSGLQLGAGVWWPPGLYLGEITDLRQHSAVVELVSAPQVTHAATVAGTPITTTGRGGGELYAELPQSVEVPVGTAVISQRFDLPLGVVAATESLSATNMQALYITRFVSSTDLNTVFVAK